MTTFARASAIALCTVTAASGCGLDPAAPDNAPVNTTVLAAEGDPGLLTEAFKNVPPEIKALLADAGAVASAFSGVGAAVGVVTTLLSAVHIIGNGADANAQQFAALNQHLDAVAGALSWQISAEARGRRLQQELAAVQEAGAIVEVTGGPVDQNSPTELQSRTALLEGEDISAFQRVFVESATDAPVYWKSFIRARPVVSNGNVYDWRLGVPALLRLLSLRINVIAAVDPDFAHHYSHFSDELMQHRDVLLSHYFKMSDGVQCIAANEVWINWTFHKDIGCADIYTGLGGFMTYGTPTDFTPEDDARAEFLRRKMDHEMRHTMPFFEMAAMIDTLYQYANPAKDLAEADRHIPLDANTNLCLQATDVDAPDGTAVMVGDCFTTDDNQQISQWWLYDRKQQTIVYGLSEFALLAGGQPSCLEVVGGNQMEGASVQIATCNGSDKQRWSYDPEYHTLRSGTGTTVLSADGLFPGSGIHTAGWTADDQQRWSATQEPRL